MPDLIERNPVTGCIFVLLLATLCSWILAGTTPLPFGGPDIVFALMTGGVSLAYLFFRITRQPVAVSREFVVLVGISLGILIVSAGVHAFFAGTFFVREVAWIIMGMGVLLASWMSVTTWRRMMLLLSAFVFCVLISGLFGLLQEALVLDSEPSARPRAPSIYPDRLEGLSSTVHLAPLIAMAVPVFFSMFLQNFRHNFFCLTPRRNCLLTVMLVVVLVVMGVILLKNGSRSAALGSIAGMIVAGCLSLLHEPFVRRQVIVVALLLICGGGSALLIWGSGSHVLHERLVTIDRSALDRVMVIGRTFRHAWLHPWGTDPNLVLKLQEYKWFWNRPPPVVEIDPPDPEVGQWVTMTAIPPWTVGSAEPSWQWQTRTWHGWADISRQATIRQNCWMPQGCRKTFRLKATYGNVAWDRGTRYMTVEWRGALHPSGVTTPRQIVTWPKLPGELHEYQGLPHNQFLEILLKYGFPGLLLLAAFYAVSIRSLFHAVRSALHRRDNWAVSCTLSIAAALTSYLVFGLAQTASPFSDHWYMFFLFGIIPVARVLACWSGQASDERSCTNRTP